MVSYSSRGISAGHITGDSNKEMKDSVLSGKYQLVYITPELLISGTVWRKMLTGEVYESRLKAFVVDEAHTVKKWYVNTYKL